MPRRFKWISRLRRKIPKLETFGQLGRFVGWGLLLLTAFSTLSLPSCSRAGLKVPGFDVQVTPESIDVKPGDTIEFTVRIVPKEAFSGEVSVRLVSAPDGFALSPDHITVTGKTTTETFTVTVPPTAEPIELQLELEFTAGGARKRLAIRVNVRLPAAGTWTPRDSGTTTHLHAVEYLNGTFIAVGDAGTVLTSTDGVQWTAHGSDDVRHCNFVDVTYGNGVFFMVGGGGAGCLAFWNPTANTWSPKGYGYYYTRGAVYLKGIYITFETNSFVEHGYTHPDKWWCCWAVGPPGAGVGTARGAIYSKLLNAVIIVSQEGGINIGADPFDYQNGWHVGKPRDTSVPLLDVTEGDGYLAAVGPEHVLVSTNGYDWKVKKMTLRLREAYLKDVAIGNGRFVAVGMRCSIFASPDGESWAQEDCGLNRVPDLNGVAYGNGVFVAVGDFGTILTSP